MMIRPTTTPDDGFGSWLQEQRGRSDAVGEAARALCEHGEVDGDWPTVARDAVPAARTEYERKCQTRRGTPMRQAVAPRDSQGRGLYGR